jgi:amino acid transporter
MNNHQPDHEQGTTVIQRTSLYEPPRSWRTWLFGRPLSTADAPNETIGKLVGLAVFASDALSSTAYATQEILFILAVAGTMAFGNAFPIAIAIVILLAIVTLSYEQTIHAYPGGGGAYIVASDNLGEMSAMIAGAALLTDYILTVAVSVSAGVAQIVSAFPVLFDLRVWISVGMVFFVMLLNLRGVKESGFAFAIPTYLFILIMFTTVGVGIFRQLTGSLGAVVNPPELEVVSVLAGITPFLILHAFSSGTAALTGVEAISNGITAFKEPRSHNAGVTLILMALILGSLFLGISYLAVHIEAIPSEFETVISQIARTVFDTQGFMYLAVIIVTTIILILAANTAFAGFPRLSAQLAADGFLPRQLTYRGSRLVYSRGIGTLALIACLLIVVFQSSVSRLIPLYAIGVFLSFTLSQAGMARRWWKIGHRGSKPEPSHASTISTDRWWKLKMVVNGFGAVCTIIVMMVFAVTKFSDGAWIVLVLLPALVLMFWLIHSHYRQLAGKLSLENFGAPTHVARHRVLLLISGVHRGSLAALRYARALTDDVTAVHVCIETEDADKIKNKWEQWGEGVRLVILDSPYRLLMEPLLEYIEGIAAKRQPNETITIVVPQFVPKKRIHNLLHTNTVFWLRLALLFKPGIVITDVPYQVE